MVLNNTSYQSEVGIKVDSELNNHT